MSKMKFWPLKHVFPIDSYKVRILSLAFVLIMLTINSFILPMRQETRIFFFLS